MATETELLEVFRLGELACDREIVQVVGDRLAGLWMARSRFKDTELLTRRSLALQTSAGTLNWCGHALLRLGDTGQALTFFNQALPLRRAVGDRAGEAVTRYNIGMIHRRAGRLADAVTELEVTVELDRQVQHPDLASDTAMLEQVRAELVSRGVGGPSSGGV